MQAEQVKVNEFNGVISYTITLKRGMNIIAGENGTGKTRLLQTVKSGTGVTAFDSESFNNHRVFAINPKRNSERHELNQIVQQMRRNNKSYSNFSEDAVNKHFNAGGFDNYSSFGELFMYYFDKLDRDGGERIASMKSVVSEFNSVIRSVFKEYEISANWDSNQGLPMPIIKKRGMEVPITGLSCGEAELFSLALNLYTLRDQFDVFLIDEPETHLNWHLEKLLFKYLIDFTKDYNKQLVVATHSRVVVDPEFSEYAQFLFWDESSVSVSAQLPKNQREKLVEDAYQTLKVNGFANYTIFCEDESHRIYLDSLCESLEIDDLYTSKCGNANNVKSLYRRNLEDGGWTNSLFMVDGDGDGQWKDASKGFIKIKKYCIENYAFNLAKSSVAYGRDQTVLQNKLVELLQIKKSSLFNKSKSLDFLVDLLEPSHITQDRIDQLDGSQIFPEFSSWLGFNNYRDFWDMIFSKCKDPGNEMKYEDFVDDSLFNALCHWANESNLKEPEGTAAM